MAGGAAAVRGEIQAQPPVTDSKSVRKRWLLLAAAAVVGFAIAFGLGLGVKSSTPSQPAAQQLTKVVQPPATPASVTALQVGVVVPGLKVTPKHTHVAPTHTHVPPKHSTSTHHASSTTPVNTTPTHTSGNGVNGGTDTGVSHSSG